MRFKPWLIFPALLLVTLGVIWWFGHYAQTAQASNTLRVVGALDMQPLAEAVKKDFTASSQQELEFIPSRNTLADLRTGKAEAALLGREPTLTELGEFQDYPIALDAVCILINQRTYNGGIQDAYIQGATNPNGQPAVKYEGLKNFSMDDLRGFMSMTLGFDNNIWTFTGSRAGYLTFQFYLDPINQQPVPDPDHPGWYNGQWVWNDVQLVGEALTPGMFDTQAALLQKLGLPESVLNGSRVSFINPVYDSEELLISRTYGLDPKQADQESTIAFNYFLEIASRRITVRALQHKFAIRALSINDVDPLSDPSVIYDGSYPLSRTIHLLIRKPPTRQGQEFGHYLLSPGAQDLISKAGYLPINPAP